MDFKQKFKKISTKNDSLLCVGLDIDKNKMPGFLFKKGKNPYFEFNKAIINSTKDLVCAYKLNMAFYEALGEKGIKLLKQTMEIIPKNVITILDGKRNDIGNTARKYAESLFEFYRADAVTLNPYMGSDSVLPFLDYKDKYSFILCRTSNPSASEFQDMISNNSPIYKQVAKKIFEWNENENCGAVVGATYPEELKEIREIIGDKAFLLIPGIGAQGGDIEKTVKNGINSDSSMAIINSSRGIIYAENNEKFAQKSREKALEIHDKINKYR